MQHAVDDPRIEQAHLADECQPADLAIELERVDLVGKRCANGADFGLINPKGYVPALQLDDGELLTEGTAISQYLADLAPQRKLLAPVGHRERYRVLSWLGFINSELHKRFSPLFKAETNMSDRARVLTELHARFALVEETLQEQPWLGGQEFSIADAYLFVVAGWSRHVRLDLSPYSLLLAFQRRCAERPRVVEAMSSEGLLAKPVAGVSTRRPREGAIETS